MRRIAAPAVALLGALALAPSGLADTGLAPVSPVSPNVEEAREMYYVVLAVAAVVFAAVTIPLLYFVVRYRGRVRDVDGAQVHGHARFELAWTAIPALILVVIAAIVFVKLPGIVDIETAAGERELEVRVEGRQFYWRYEYPNGVVVIDRLRVPLDRVVNLTLTAPDGDVNHSFWVPPVGAKIDAIPGQENHTEFRARELGVYEGQCAEFCGLQHAAMLATIEVIPPGEFDAWLAGEQRAQSGGTSSLGSRIWEGVCAKCHGPDVAGEIGPPLEGNPTLADRDALATIVRNGRGAMPPVGQEWTDRELDALFRYTSRTIARAGGEG